MKPTLINELKLICHCFINAHWPKREGMLINDNEYTISFLGSKSIYVKKIYCQCCDYGNKEK